MRKARNQAKEMSYGHIGVLDNQAIPREARSEYDLRQQVEQANHQLTLYALQLGDLAERERQKAHELSVLNDTLQTYAMELRASIEREQLKTRELENAYLDMVRRLTRASAWKDQETGSHMERLTEYSRTLALAIGLPHEAVHRIATVAPMHDVGKIGIPDHILRKQGPLSEEEWVVMKQHPVIGARLLEGSQSELLELASQVALGHHERWDGSGYPLGRRGEEIPVAARIVALADNYDALRSPRAYKPGLPHEQAYDIITNGDSRTRPEHFDPTCLNAFLHVHREFADIYARIGEPEYA
ncbi:MAG: HD domain-containing protein [Acidobacteria bacterium]|nr:HD domain-containing protein [Acidobacteriota bacterium]